MSRSSPYYEPKGESEDSLALMRRMDQLHMDYLFYANRQMARHLRREGTTVGRHRVRRLMRKMGIEAIYRRPKTSVANPEHRVFPYLLRGVEVSRADQVWCADITYVPVSRGFFYLVAVMDWATRHVLAWELSNTMDASFCVSALEEALGSGRPEIFNTDQGLAVHERSVRGVGPERQDPVLDGRAGAVPGQHLHRAVADAWRGVPRGRGRGMSGS